MRNWVLAATSILALALTGCGSPGASSDSFSGPGVSLKLPSGWQHTTITPSLPSGDYVLLVSQENVIYLDRQMDFPYIQINRESMNEVNQNLTAGKRAVSLNELGQYFLDHGPGQIVTATCVMTDRTLTPLKIDGEKTVYISMDCLHEQARWYVTIHKDWAYYMIVVDDKAVFDRTLQTVNSLVASWKWNDS